MSDSLSLVVWRVEEERIEGLGLRLRGELLGDTSVLGRLSSNIDEEEKQMDP